MEKVKADDFDYLGYDELYDLYDLEDEIEAVEPKDDLEPDNKTLLATEIKSEADSINEADHEKI